MPIRCWYLKRMTQSKIAKLYQLGGGIWQSVHWIVPDSRLSEPLYARLTERVYATYSNEVDTE